MQSHEKFISTWTQFQIASTHTDTDTDTDQIFMYGEKRAKPFQVSIKTIPQPPPLSYSTKGFQRQITGHFS